MMDRIYVREDSGLIGGVIKLLFFARPYSEYHSSGR